MKTLNAHQGELTKVLGYAPTVEFTKKLLTSLDVKWREEPRWSLPLRLVGNDRAFIDLIDADESVLVSNLDLSEGALLNLQRILSAANAELARQVPAKRPLYFTQGSPE